MNALGEKGDLVLGAGLQSQARLTRYRETIKRACLQGIKVLNNGKDASEAACIAVAVLEVIAELAMTRAM